MPHDLVHDGEAQGREAGYCTPVFTLEEEEEEEEPRGRVLGDFPNVSHSAQHIKVFMVGFRRSPEGRP